MNVRHVLESELCAYFEELKDMGYATTTSAYSIMILSILDDIINGDFKQYNSKDDFSVLSEIFDKCRIPTICSCID